MSSDIAADAQDAAELKESQQDAADAQVAVEELTEAANVLCALRDHTVATLADTQDVKASTVAAIRTGVDMVMGRVGEAPLPLVAMESMDAGCLELTLEAIGEKLKQIWEAIKAALAKFFQAIANLFKTSGDNAEKAAAATKKTIDDLGSVDPSTPPPAPEKANKPNVLAHFTINNKVPTDFLEQCKSALSGLKWVFIDNGETEQHLEQLSRVIASRPVDKLNDPALSEDIVTFFTNVGKRFQAIKGGGSAGVPAESAGDPQVATGLMPGDVAISVKIPRAGQSLANSMGSATINVWHRQRNVDNLAVPGNLTREQLISALEDSERFLSDMSSFGKGSVPRIEALSKMILNSGQQLVGRGTPETEGSLQGLVHMLNGYVHHVLQIRQSVMSYGYGLCGAMNALAKEYTSAPKPEAEASAA